MSTKEVPNNASNSITFMIMSIIYVKQTYKISTILGQDSLKLVTQPSVFSF